MNPVITEKGAQIKEIFRLDGFPDIKLDLDEKTGSGTVTIKGSSPTDYPNTPFYGPGTPVRTGLEKLFGDLDISLRASGFLQALHDPQIPTVTLTFKPAADIDLADEEFSQCP